MRVWVWVGVLQRSLGNQSVRMAQCKFHLFEFVAITCILHTPLGMKLMLVQLIVIIAHTCIFGTCLA